MCVTHIYTDLYPKRTVEFHQTIVCSNAKDGTSCSAHITNEHPPRTLESNDERSSKEYIDQGLKVPSSKPSPQKFMTTTTYRYSQGDKTDKSPVSGREPRLLLVEKKSALVSALTPRRKHPKERIVIVDAPDSPQGSKTLQKYAPDSPATEEFYSKNLLQPETPHRQESSSSRRSPNRSLNPVRTVVVERHREEREHSQERDRLRQELPTILAPEPPSRSPSRERALLDSRIRREEEERERDRQREYERERERSFELVHEARREQERERENLRNAAEELERERMRREKGEDERRREAEYQNFLSERGRERERESANEVERKRAREVEEEMLREWERTRSSERKREEESAREKERRRREEEIRRAGDHEQERREEKHRREREMEEREREDRMRKAAQSERKAADDARRLAEQVKSFAREDEEIRRRTAVTSRERDRGEAQERWKREDEEMYNRLRERQVRAEFEGLGLGHATGGVVRGGRDGESAVLDRLKERQKEPEVEFVPKRRMTVAGGSGGERSGRRRGDERIVWDGGDGGRSGRW